MRRRAGPRVGVTRARSQGDELIRLLREAGAEPIELPVIELLPPTSWAALDDALIHLDRYAGALFTSANAVDRCLDRAALVAPDADPSGLFVAVSGSGTAGALERRGIRVDLVPRRFRSEELLAALVDRWGARLPGSRWLLPRAEVAREVLPEGLRAAGALVDVAPAYRIGPPEDPEPLRAALASGLDLITFASGSAVENLLDLAGGLPEGVAVATIGPVTSAACRARGLSVAVEAEEARIRALVDAVIGWRR